MSKTLQVSQRSVQIGLPARPPTRVLESVSFVTKQQSNLAIVKVNSQSAEGLIGHDHH